MAKKVSKHLTYVETGIVIEQLKLLGEKDAEGFYVYRTVKNDPQAAAHISGVLGRQITGGQVFGVRHAHGFNLRPPSKKAKPVQTPTKEPSLAHLQAQIDELRSLVKIQKQRLDAIERRGGGTGFLSLNGGRM